MSSNNRGKSDEVCLVPAQLIDNRLRRALLCLLLGVYLLVYVPEPDSADANALLAAAAAWTRYGSPDINAIAHGEWFLAPISRLGAPGLDGALYTKKGITPSLAFMPLVLLADALPPLSTRATAMLFNPLVTAGTALLLYALARRLDVRPRAAFALALLYGAATFAVVYVKTLFGEPLAAFLLLLALLKLVDYRQRGHWRALLLAGAALGALIGVNAIYALFPAIFGVFLLWVYVSRHTRPLEGEAQRTRQWRVPTEVAHWAAFALPVVLALGFIGALNWARFGSPFDSGYHFAEGEGFTRPIPLGVYGLLISPYRGVFWYNPLLLLALPGWLMLRRRAAALAWLLLALVGAQIAAFAGWWSWHGGIVWGPRFLLPAVPLLMLMLAPLLEWALDGRKRDSAKVYARWLARIALVFFVMLSLGAQLLGALYSYYPYQFYLNIHYGTDIWDSPVTLLRDEVLYDPALSPIIGHIALWTVGWKLEPAWLAGGVDWLHGALALILIAAGGAALLARQRRHSWVIAPIVVCLGIAAARAGDPSERARIRELESVLQPAGTVVVASTAFDETLVDVERSGRIITMNAPTPPDDPLARGLWRFARSRGGWLWYVTWFGALDPLDWGGRDLWTSAAYVTERTAAGHRALLFRLDEPPLTDQPGGWLFDDSLRLASYAAARDAAGVYARLDWMGVESMDADYTWFVHLVDSGGNILAQQDRAPQGGYAPTSTWGRGATITDRLYFPLDAAARESPLRLRIGWIQQPGGDLLPVRAADGTLLPESFALLNIP